MGWVEDQAVTFDDSTPAKTVEGKGTIDLAALGYKAVVIQFEITFGDAADGNAEIRFRSSSDSGGKKDTILINPVSIPFTVSGTKRISFQFLLMPYLEIGVYNGNSAAQDITIAAKYAGYA